MQAEFGEALQTVQGELGEVRDRRLGPAERRIDALEKGLLDVSGEATRLRDEALPASVARSDALLGRLAEELEEVASLVERSLRGEPLPAVDSVSVSEDRLAESLNAVQPLLLESFRGSGSEIRHRLDRYLSDLQSSPPVLDLGCGRGELLLLLREAGVEATGIEGDTALAGAAPNGQSTQHNRDNPSPHQLPPTSRLGLFFGNNGPHHEVTGAVEDLVKTATKPVDAFGQYRHVGVGNRLGSTTVILEELVGRERVEKFAARWGQTGGT